MCTVNVGVIACWRDGKKIVQKSKHNDPFSMFAFYNILGKVFHWAHKYDSSRSKETE